jgi:hypothetical protein
MTATALQDPHTAPPEPSLTDKFCARLDQHIETLPSENRLRFLLDLRIEWLAKFDRFTTRVDAGEAPHFGETAFDYASTIAEISKRIAEQGHG